MSLRKRSWRLALIALLPCIALLLLATPTPVVQKSLAQDSCLGCGCGPGPLPQDPRSFDDFIRRAYLGALGRQPTCAERNNEYNRLVAAMPVSSDPNSAFDREARRFVSTLFQTQASFDDPSLDVYAQTTAYQARNPWPDNRLNEDATRAFVTDCYHAFLQREPDAEGLCYWTKVALGEVHGRKHVLRAFEDSIEFNDLVSKLFDSGPPCCITRCPIGTVFNPDTCSCESDGGCTDIRFGCYQ
jgi:hypothetical protein